MKTHHSVCCYTKFQNQPKLGSIIIDANTKMTEIESWQLIPEQAQDLRTAAFNTAMFQHQIHLYNADQMLIRSRPYIPR